MAITIRWRFATEGVLAPRCYITLLYDGSARPSTATTNGLLSTEISNKGGADSAIVPAKADVQFTGRPVRVLAASYRKLSFAR